MRSWLEGGRRPRGAHLALAAVLLIALGLRLWGLGFGLPNLYHPDEDALVMPAIQMIKTGDLLPSRLEYGSLHIYSLAAVSAVVFVLLARAGLVVEPAELPLYERGSYPAVYAYPQFFLAARLVSAVMGVGVVLLTYLLARRLAGRRVGLLAAGMAAVLPLLVIHSHYATPDMPLTFLVLLTLYLLLRAHDRWHMSSPWAYAGAGFVCGLAASTKYNGVVLAAPLLLVPIFKARSLDDWLSGRTLAGPLAMAAGFLAGTPAAVLDLPRFLYWLGYSLHLYAAPGYEPVGTSLGWHLDYLLTSPSAPLVVLGLAGLALSVWRWGRRGWLLTSFALLLWLAIFGQTRREARMWLPTMALFCLWAGLALQRLFAWGRQRYPDARLRPAAAASLALLALWLLTASLLVDLRLAAADVRTQAAAWIAANLPVGTPIGIDYFAPNLDPARYPATRAFPAYRKEPAWFQERGLRYVLLSQAGNDLTKLSPADRAGWQRLTAGACLTHSFAGPFLATASIQMWLYELPPCR
ncbi:MAG: ArnT family glycosyltransferase [Candidatus Promineifilaceae bacterium]